MVDFPPDAEELAETSRLSIEVEGIDLPTDEDARQAMLDEITDKVDQIIEEEGLSANNATANAGHQYTQIPPDCPRCEHPLSVRRPVTLDDDLPASVYTSIYCSQCSYMGGSVYRLVDIETNKYVSEAKAEQYRSEVNDRKVFPEYHSY